MSVKTNIGREFLNLLDKHFGINSKLHTIINRSKVKVSYSCNTNIARLIQNHNTKILNKISGTEQNEEIGTCNCRIKNKCPLDNKCTKQNLVYQAEVTSTSNNNIATKRFYLGQTSRTFKERWRVHTNTFRNRNCKNPTELTKYIWKLEDKNINWQIKWKIIGHAKPYAQGDKFCALCNYEKTEIIFFEEKNKLLNSMNIVEKCRHRKSKVLESAEDTKSQVEIPKLKECQVVLKRLTQDQINHHSVIPAQEDVIPPDKNQPMIRKSERIRKPKKILDL